MSCICVRVEVANEKENPRKKIPSMVKSQMMERKERCFIEGRKVIKYLCHSERPKEVEESMKPCFVKKIKCPG